MGLWCVVFVAVIASLPTCVDSSLLLPPLLQELALLILALLPSVQVAFSNSLFPTGDFSLPY